MSKATSVKKATAVKSEQPVQVIPNVVAATRALDLNNKCNTIKRMYSEGYTQKEIIAITNFNPVTVYRQARSFAIANANFNFAEAQAKMQAKKAAEDAKAAAEDAKAVKAVRAAKAAKAPKAIK